MSDALFRGAFHSISADFQHADYHASMAAWRDFLTKTLICKVAGERPNPADSGYIYARAARQVLGLPEEQVKEPPACVEAVLLTPHRPIVFVDDFLGSGHQFATMWHREHQVSGQLKSLSTLSKTRDVSVAYYCPLIATQRGINVLNRVCPQVRVRPAHILSAKTSPLHPETEVFPKGLRGQGQEMIRRVSRELSLPDSNGKYTCDWQGYRRLGCALAFAHGVPDATLPIFYTTNKGWRPLKERR
jgi:hypothetical protein